MDRGAWRAAAHEVTQSWTQLSNFHLHLHLLDNKVSSLVSTTAPANKEKQSCLPDLMHVEPLGNQDHVEHGRINQLGPVQTANQRNCELINDSVLSHKVLGWFISQQNLIDTDEQNQIHTFIIVKLQKIKDKILQLSTNIIQKRNNFLMKLICKRFKYLNLVVSRKACEKKISQAKKKKKINI